MRNEEYIEHRPHLSKMKERKITNVRCTAYVLALLWIAECCVIYTEQGVGSGLLLCRKLIVIELLLRQAAVFKLS
jgi:hypothetical protein